MTEPPLDSNSLQAPRDLPLATSAIEPSAEVDERVRRLGHAALLAAHSSARMTRVEWALSSALILSYAAYAASRIVLIFERV